MCEDFGNAYVAVRTNYMHSFQVCRFPTLPLCVFVLWLAKSEVSVHGEVLSSLWLAAPTQYTTTLISVRRLAVGVSPGRHYD